MRQSPPFDVQAVVAGDARLSPAQAVWLFEHASLHDLGRWAFEVARRKVAARYPDTPDVRTYVIDRNINYTNVCSADCTFCAFKRDLHAAGSYVLDRRQLHDKVAELVAIGGTQVLLQGGMHPELPLAWYEEMLRAMKADFPGVHIHGFSPPEFVEFVAVFDLPGFPTPGPSRSHLLPAEVWREKLAVIMHRLRDAGLDSIPGGGGEIFAPHVRRRIGIRKASAEQWLDVMTQAHRLGMHTSATMMFGHIEGVADRVDHLRRVRDRQDLAMAQRLPGGYVSFIAWPFQRENTPLGRIHDWDQAGEFPGDELARLVMAGEVDAMDKGACRRAVPAAGRSLRMSGAHDYLRTQAISRLFLDNIYSIGSSWVTMGPKIGQLGLMYGATDMGSVMMEENVVSAAGTTYCLDEAVLCRLIRDSGFTPAQRDNRYRLLKVHDGEAAPDRVVTDWSQHRARRLHVESREKAVDLTLTAAQD